MIMASRCVQWGLASALAAALLPLPLWAGVYEIKDREGFDRPLTAHATIVPDGWVTEGRIAWIKPCSSNDLFETLFTTRSPDGRSGARIMPGYQFFDERAYPTPGYPRDPMIDMMLAQSAASVRNMATQFRGSNCAVGAIGDTQDILDRLILPNRPQGASVRRIQPNESELTAMRQALAGGLPGVEIRFDAQIVDLSYSVGGIPTAERLYLSWYSFAQMPMDMAGVTVGSTHVVIEPLRFVWTPLDEAAQRMPRLTGILTGMRTNPEWQRRIDKVYADLRKQNDADRARREAASDKRHKEFIEMIAGTRVEGGAGTGASGATPTPGGTAPDPVTADEDTDFWGEPKKEKNFWGEEKTDEEKKWDF